MGGEICANKNCSKQLYEFKALAKGVCCLWITTRNERTNYAKYVNKLHMKRYLYIRTISSPRITFRPPPLDKTIHTLVLCVCMNVVSTEQWRNSGINHIYCKFIESINSICNESFEVESHEGAASWGINPSPLMGCEGQRTTATPFVDNGCDAICIKSAITHSYTIGRWIRRVEDGEGGMRSK